MGKLIINKIMKTKIAIIIGIVIVVSVGTVVYFNSRNAILPANNSLTSEGGNPFRLPQESSTTRTSPSILIASPVDVPVVESGGPLAEWVTDLADDRKMVGASHNIFVAKIIREVGDVRRLTMLETQVEAEVILNIKGNLQGNVIVDTFGGYRDGKYYVPRGGTRLTPGWTYLLATRYDKQLNWHHLDTYPTTWKLISQNTDATSDQLKTLAGSDSRVNQLQAVYPKEILLNADVAHNETLNSYQSLTEAQKYALPYYTGSYNPNPPAPTSTIATSTASSTTSSTTN